MSLATRLAYRRIHYGWIVAAVTFLSAATLTVGVALTPLMRAPWQLILLWGVVVGAGTGMTALVLGTPVERHGWRTATLLVAGAVLLIIPLVFLLLRERPEDVGLARFGEQGLPGRATGGAPVSTSAGALAALRQGARSRDFWLLAGSFFICGASTNGLIGTHLIPTCIDHGISEVRGRVAW